MKTLYLQDATYASTEGLFSSKIYVKKSLLYYIVDLATVGCSGQAKFSFGSATNDNLKIASQINKTFEDALITLTYNVKHSYMNNIDYFSRLATSQPIRVKKFLPDLTYQITEGAFTSKIYAHNKQLIYVVSATSPYCTLGFDFLYSVATKKNLKSLRDIVKGFEIVLLNVASDIQTLFELDIVSTQSK